MFQELDDPTLTPQELAGKQEFDEIQRRYLPLFEEAERNPDPHEVDMVAHDRDYAENELLEKSACARAYLKCITAQIPKPEVPTTTEEL